MGIADVVFPLVGVVIGGGITSGAEVWKRGKDKADSDLAALTEAVLAVQDTGTDAMYRCDQFTVTLFLGPSLMDVTTSEARTVMNQAAAKHLGAVARARIATAPYPGLREKLIDAQDFMRDLLLAARTAAAAIGTPEHHERLIDYSQLLDATTAAQNEFTLAAVQFFEARADKGRPPAQTT